MITSEAEIRVALQAVLIAVLALYGCWGCAAMVLIILLPWKPIFAVGSYLAQPLVDWRMQKACYRQEKGIAQIEEELDALLGSPKGSPKAATQVVAAKPAMPQKPTPPTLSRPLETFQPNLPAGPAFKNMPEAAQTLSGTLAIPPAIKDHVRNLPQAVFNNMNLEVEEVKFQGDTAEAYVRFQSPNVTELSIRQRYVLRKSGDHWQVESRQPANGAGKAPQLPLPIGRPPMQLT